MVTTWQTTELSYLELYTLYNTTNPENQESNGIFYALKPFDALKPFYARGATPADLEMFCSKNTLHARWAVKGLLI